MNFWSAQIKRGAAARAHDPAFVDPHSKMSWSELETFTHSVTDFLKHNNFAKEDRVLVILPRGTAAAAMTAGLLANDVSVLAIERSNVAASLVSTIEKLAPRLLIFLEADHEKIKSLLPMAIDLNAGFQLSSREQIRAATLPIKTKPSVPELGWLLQTSGTTREPKLVMISRQNLVARAQGEVRDFRLTSNDNIINTLSFTHDVGFNQLLATLAANSTLQIQTQPFASALVSTLKSARADGISATPLLWNQAMALTKDSFAGFRYVAVSGGSLKPNELRQLSQQFPGAELLRTYGQTETFRTLLNRDDDFESLGLPISGVMAKLTEDGELVHVGEGSMLGYFDAPDATKEKLAGSGIRTGDLFVLDARGRYRYKGRNDDMIKRFDVRMHLKEIEDAVAQVEGVTATAVISKPAPHDDPRENLIAVFLTIHSTSKISARDLIQSCKAILEPSKQPDLIEILPEMPRTAGHKINRAELRQLWDQR